MLRGVHHVAYVVNDLDKFAAMMERVFGMKPDRRETVEAAGQEVLLYEMTSGATLEVIRTLHENTRWAEFIRDHGEGIEHIGYAVEGIDDRLVELDGRGVSLLHKQSRMSGVGWRVANIAPESTDGLSFQLVQP